MGCGKSSFDLTHFQMWKQTSTYLGKDNAIDIARIGQLLSLHKGDILSFELTCYNISSYSIEFVVWKQNPYSISCVCNDAPYSVRTFDMRNFWDDYRGFKGCDCIITCMNNDYEVYDIILNIRPTIVRAHKRFSREAICCPCNWYSR